MDLRRIIFVGGGFRQSAAIQVRCLDIAQRLGCRFVKDVRLARQIPDRYDAFVCVKTALSPGELLELGRRGKVIWDILDTLPPEENVSVYLASTKLAGELFGNYGRVEVIPHHHCNFEAQPTPPGNRRPAWIGSSHWLPRLRGFEYDTYLVEGKTREQIAQAFRQTGIGLNFRGTERLKALAQRRAGTSPAAHRQAVQNTLDFHLAVNSGIKLINCLGFGIPSVSSSEPAYHEFGENCTIFSGLKDCAKWVRALQNDGDLYRGLRQKCLCRAARFHIDTIAEKYRTLLRSL